MALHLNLLHEEIAEQRQRQRDPLKIGIRVLFVLGALMVAYYLWNAYKVLEAPSGPAALKILESPQRIDLLITDVGLPGGMNGRQVADAARALRPDLKVLFITGYAENAAIGNGHLEPGMEILTKPFPMNALASKVRHMLEN